jgi:hypothetical protein
MRPPVDASRIRELARRLGRSAPSRVRIYLTGGATAVLEGWRQSTIDVDVRFEPEADELLRRLPELKEELGVNVELASPPDFVPELPGWRDRSPLVFREGKVDVHHFDPYSQALSKIERGFEHDLDELESRSPGAASALGHATSNRAIGNHHRAIRHREKTMRTTTPQPDQM